MTEPLRTETIVALDEEAIARIDALAAQLGLTRDEVLVEAVHRGLDLAEDALRSLIAQRKAPRGHGGAAP